MFVDIHTHIDKQSVIKIVDGDVEKVLKTVGIHPWELDRHFDRPQGAEKSPTYFAGDFSIPLRSSRNDELKVSVGMTAAIGEVGLDKVHKETFEKQLEVFEEMIRLSESCRKPMIIHCVRAYSEIIAARKKTKAVMPWVIHGFNSSVDTMRQLLRHNMYISLGEVLYRNENQAIDILKNIPPDRLFLETDVSGRDIRDVYAKAAELMNCDIDFLCRQIFENYGRLETTDTDSGR